MERGALGVVLHFCRVAGIAPFIRGAENRVSLALVICAKLFITFTVVFYVICAAISPLWNQKYGSLFAFDILRMTSTLFAVITAFTSVFTSSERIKRMMKFLKELAKIDKKVSQIHRLNISEKKLTIQILIFLHVILGIRCYDFLHNVHYFHVDNVSLVVQHFTVIIAYYMINLSEVQLILFTQRTMLSFKLINDCLEKIYRRQSLEEISKIHLIHKPPILAWEDVNEVPSVNARSERGNLIKTKGQNIQEPVILIRQCIANYMHVCKIIRESTEGDSILIAILILYNIIHILTHTYKLILYAVTPDPRTFEPNLLLAIYWFIIYSVTLIIFVEPIHKTQSEMHRLQLLLISLKLKNLDKEDIYNELLLFWRIINLNKPTYSPLEMFTLNRLLIVKIFGSLVTFLVILITYGPEMKNIHLQK